MAEMPKRDTTGKCEGECMDRVAKMEKDQQEKLNETGTDYSTAETPTVDHTNRRDNAPGNLGGHVSSI
jgi:hypothetical protein